MTTVKGLNRSDVDEIVVLALTAGATVLEFTPNEKSDRKPVIALDIQTQEGEDFSVIYRKVRLGNRLGLSEITRKNPANNRMELTTDTVLWGMLLSAGGTRKPDLEDLVSSGRVTREVEVPGGILPDIVCYRPILNA